MVIMGYLKAAKMLWEISTCIHLQKGIGTLVSSFRIPFS
jgi:hypothetical protein